MLNDVRSSQIHSICDGRVRRKGNAQEDKHKRQNEFTFSEQNPTFAVHQMKTHLIKKQSVLLYAQEHARSSASFSEWLEKIKYAD